MKNLRHEKILDIISRHNIATQNELADHLKKEGFYATQATLSRDIRELKLIKTQMSTGGYYYKSPDNHEEDNISLSLNSVFLQSVKSVDYANNIVVIKCLQGMAGAVCETMDNWSFEGVLGTIAGDNTIFMVVKTEHEADAITEYLRNTIVKK